jgi:hypothetical protein
MDGSTMSLPTEDKARKSLPIFTFLTEYFPDAIIEMVNVCVAGNIQYNKDRAPADIVWDRSKSTNQLDTAFRHLWDHKRGTVKDADQMYHLAKTAWRVLAELQLQIERDSGQAIGNLQSQAAWVAGQSSQYADYKC